MAERTISDIAKILRPTSKEARQALSAPRDDHEAQSMAIWLNEKLRLQ